MKRCLHCGASCLPSHRHCPSCGADVSQVEVITGDPFVGVTLAGKYRLAELIGEGAMGRVYRADHLALDAQVAVKLLNSEVATDQQTARRFQTEARAASRLRHPNTIQILDFGQSESGVLYLVMEYLRGRTLARLLEEAQAAPLALQRIADLLGQALSALDEAHAAGVVHRDFKPENIFVETLRTGREHVKVLDFGIAKLRGEQEANLTSRGSVCGTPEYMSPEQIRGEELDARSDVYAAGVVLYEMLSGERPFESHGPVIEILTAHLNKAPEPPHLRRPDRHVPRALEQVCLKAMAKQREQRYRSAAEFKGALEVAARGTGTHCQQCGAVLTATARFCAECGAVIKPQAALASTMPSLPRTPSSQQAPAQPQPQPQQRPRTLPTLPLPLVGRQDVIDRLDGLDREALILAGEAGVGKTAVIAAFGERLAQRDVRMVVAGPDPSGAQVPLHPLRQAIARLLQLDTTPTAEAIAQAVADHPEDRAGLCELFHAPDASSGLPLDVRRRECWAAVLGTLRRKPICVVFEDLHGYDAPSRNLLAQLVAHPGQATVIGTSQNAEALDAEVEVLRIGPLDPLAVEQLRQVGLPSGVAELAGNSPLAITEWVRARRDNASDTTTEARLNGLSPAARSLIEAAVVAGADVGPDVIARAAGLPDATALAEARARGWLREGGEPAELGSPTLRTRVYEALDDERRRTLHRKLTELLDGGDPIVAAHHAYLSGEGGAAILESAGDHARAGFDDDAAARWYRASLDRGRQALASGGGDEGRQIRVALKLGLVQRYRGDIVQAEHVLREALELARSRKDRWAEVEGRRGLARLAQTWQDLEAARDHLVSAVAVALGGGDIATLCELYLDLADVLTRLDDAQSAERELWEGVLLATGGDGAQAEGGPAPLWRMLLALGDLARRGYRLDEARDLGKHALRHAGRVDSALGRGRAHVFLAQVHDVLNEPKPAAEHRWSAADEMRRLGDRRATAELLLALVDPKSTPKVQARAWLTEADALANQVGWREGVERSREALKKFA